MLNYSTQQGEPTERTKKSKEKDGANENRVDLKKKQKDAAGKKEERLDKF